MLALLIIMKCLKETVLKKERFIRLMVLEISAHDSALLFWGSVVRQNMDGCMWQVSVVLVVAEKIMLRDGVPNVTPPRIQFLQELLLMFPSCPQ